MTGSVEAVARRWAELWGADFGAMVHEIYSPDVAVEHAGHGPRSRVRGRDELMTAERSLLEMIPDHRNEVVRVLDGGDGRAVVESLITGTGAGDDRLQACPALVWWWFDERGKVTREVAYWEWRKRRPLDAAARGTVVGHDRAPALTLARGRRLATRLAALWTADPVAMAETMYAADAVVERLGEGEDAVLEGRETLVTAEAELLELLPVGSRRMDVHDVLVDGRAVAIAFTIGGSWRGTAPYRSGPGSLVLTLNDHDLIVSDRIYWHWDLARETA